MGKMFIFLYSSTCTYVGNTKHVELKYPWGEKLTIIDVNY